MERRKFITGGIVAGIIYFILGWIAYALYVNGIINSLEGITIYAVRHPAEFWPLLIGKMFGGFLLAYILMQKEYHTPATGFKTGAIVGFLLSASENFVIWSTTFVYSRRFFVADIVVYTIISSIAGMAIVMVAGLSNMTIDSYMRKLKPGEEDKDD